MTRYGITFIILCGILSLAFQHLAFANNITADTSTSQPITAPNAIFAELGGNCFVGSINYDRRIDRALALRIGVCPLFLTEQHSTIFIATALANSMIELGHSPVDLQFGFGLTLLTGTTDYHYPQPSLSSLPQLYYSSANEGAVTIFPTADLGFRFEPRNGGLMAQIDATTLLPFGEDIQELEVRPTFLMWCGFSLGYAF
ncbi:MAG TPA: hypothetical protein VFJ29_06315 [Candidatus Kapabacteria bacterium]|nr:hypothetical protein [Candidatus Kapabacteria bacterium]